jgi:glycosyltransferase involved in cell wall biosynthesis
MLRGNPYIYLIFDVYPDTSIQLGLLRERGLVAILWNLCNRFTFRYASLIVVIGRCMDGVIRRKMSQAMHGKIRTIHIWSDDKRIQSIAGKRSPFIEQWGLHGKFVVAYSGNMGRFHDMETILEAAKSLREYQDITFLFIGEGHKKQWMKEFAEQWKLSNCQFHTYVVREMLGFSLSCADVGLVSLARGQEGLSVPSKTLGLMAAGVPVIGIMSNISEIGRVITEEECGVVIEPGDSKALVRAILELHNTPERLKTMGENARNAIQGKYNLRSAAQAYYEMVCDLNGLEGRNVQSVLTAEGLVGVKSASEGAGVPSCRNRTVTHRAFRAVYKRGQR